MNYNELTIDELKNIAKSKNISSGNSGKDKLIEKLIKYDLEESSKSIIESSDIVNDDNQTSENISKKIGKENLIGIINNVVSDLEDFEESEEKDDSIAEIAMDEEVPCMSITFGGLTYISALTGAKYKWHKIGDVEYITMKELVSMNNSKPAFLNTPLIILQDIRAVNKFRLVSKYEDVAKVNCLKQLFDSGDMKQIESVIESALKSGMREIVIAKVRTMYNNKVLNNTHIIKYLENILKFDLNID